MKPGKFLTPVEIKDGTYEGLWSGYEIDFDYEGRKVSVHTYEGIRGINIPATFKILDGKLVQKSVKVKKK